MPGRVWCWTLFACCIILPHCAKKLSVRLDAIPPLPPLCPLPYHIGVLEAIGGDATRM